jgi:hypothetical protein
MPLRHACLEARLAGFYRLGRMNALRPRLSSLYLMLCAIELHNSRLKASSSTPLVTVFLWCAWAMAPGTRLGATCEGDKIGGERIPPYSTAHHQGVCSCVYLLQCNPAGRSSVEAPTVADTAQPIAKLPSEYKPEAIIDVSKRLLLLGDGG